MNPDQIPSAPPDSSAPPAPSVPPVPAPLTPPLAPAPLAPAPLAPAPAPEPVPAAPVAAPVFASTPAPASMPVSTAVFTEAPAPRRGRGKLVLAILAVALIAVLGGGYAWAYRAAESALPAAATALAEADSVHVVATVDIAAEFMDVVYNVAFDAEGDIVVTDDPERPDGQIKVEAEMDGILVSGEFRKVGDTLYVMASKIPGLAFSGDPELQAMVGQWFSVTEEEFAAYSGEDSDLAVGDPQSPDDALATLVAGGAVAFEGPSIKKGDGELVREYRVQIDAENLADVVIAEARELASTTETREMVDGVEPTVREVFGAMTFEDVSVTVALLSGELRAVGGTVKVDAAKIDMADAGMPEEEPLDASVSIDFAVSYTRYGEPVTIYAPDGAKPLGELLGAQFESAQGEARDAAKKAQLASLRAAAELYADGSGSYAGFCDSTWYQEVYLPSEDALSWARCEDAPNAYVVVGDLENGSRFCVDSGGTAVELSDVMAKTTELSCL